MNPYKPPLPLSVVIARMLTMTTTGAWVQVCRQNAEALRCKSNVEVQWKKPFKNWSASDLPEHRSLMHYRARIKVVHNEST